MGQFIFTALETSHGAYVRRSEYVEEYARAFPVAALKTELSLNVITSPL